MAKQNLWTKDFLFDTIINFILYMIYYLLMVNITVFATDKLHTSLSEAGLVSGIFVLGILVARLLAGKWIEVLGRRKVLFAGVIFFFIVTLLYFVANNVILLYIIRFLHGVGFGVAATATGTIITSIIPSTRRGEGVNYFALSTSLASAIGPFLGMFFHQIAGFNFIFTFCTILLGINVILSFFLNVEEIKLTEEQLERIKGFKIESFIEFKALPISIVGIIVGLCYSSVLSFLDAYASAINLAEAGTFFFVVYASTVTITRPFTGIMFDKKGENSVMYPCYIFLALGLLLLSQTHQGWVLLLAGAFIGLGYGTFFSNGQAVSIKVSPPHRMALATSTYFLFLDFGLGIGPFLLGFLRPLVGFQGIYIVTACMAIVCFFLYYAVHGRNAGKEQKNFNGSQKLLTSHEE